MPIPAGGVTPATSAYVSIRQHTSAHVSIRQHTPGNADTGGRCDTC
jgi:hypothetical protein